ncbi:SEY1_2 [Blepharisma stoltei]|uniref:Protein SEY1 homolog n=1 Tax=Blepharisma stoltei TaxID=1481888 RepID=A0AAU9JPV8_9CILI|nr:unnamed protein product [Blepharisma stoltei]
MAMKSVQIVTFEGEFTQAMKPFLEVSGLRSTDYHIVAIIGCQSTGKSTLLNMLFGTDFDTLDAYKGRNQTTKGIHLGANLECKTLIIDIEGTDSQIRGDDGAAFEHMSALFALACADVLMVNMWTSEIGRYKAASVGLLKTIFEVNLRLFTLEKKKRILFVLRDFNDQQNNLTVLKQQMSRTLEELWSKIKKPESYILLSVFDCFDFEFKTVSVKDFKPEEFKADIDDLRDRFHNEERMDYLFRYKDTDIPLDGIPLYFQEIWTVIGNDKDLNIPSQKEMLANLRCNEIKFEALRLFTTAIEPTAKLIGRCTVPDFSTIFSEKIKEALAEYDKNGSAYYETIYLSIKNELNQLLLDQIKDLFHSQMRCVVTESTKYFKDTLESKINKGQAIENFSATISEVEQLTLSLFAVNAQASIIENSGWETAEYEAELMKWIEEKKSVEKEKQLELLQKEVKSALSGKFSFNANKILENPFDDNMWSKLKEFQASTMQELESRYTNVLKGLDFSEDQIASKLAEIRRECYSTLKSKATKYCNGLVDQLTKKFNQLFLKNENGIPREWKNAPIDEIFAQSKDTVLATLESLRLFRIVCEWDTDHGEHDYEELIGEEQFHLIMESFLKDAEMAYKEAVHIKEFGYARNKVNGWYLLLIIILGWNEFMWLLKSPIILYPLLFVFSIVALMFSMGMGAVPKFILKQALSKVPFF